MHGIASVMYIANLYVHVLSARGRMRDCGEDLLVDLSEILFNELAFFRLMQDLDDPKARVAENLRSLHRSSASRRRAVSDGRIRRFHPQCWHLWRFLKPDHTRRYPGRPLLPRSGAPASPTDLRDCQQSVRAQRWYRRRHHIDRYDD